MPKKSPAGPMRVGVIGCGNISNAYFHHTQPYGDLIQLVACADLDLARAQAKAAEHGLAKGCSVEELLADPAIDIVLNLTIPAAHAAVNEQILRAGKHAYCEKPFALTYKQGLKSLKAAQKRKLRIGCAPDTVLGGGIQTCRKLIEDGAIGRPVAATANMVCRGHERWHPNPEFYYQPGGGPLFDMGPYYLSALITLLGPAKSVSATATTTFKERVITSQPRAGKKIKVETPTHICGLVEFGRGVVANVTMSFDIWQSFLPVLEIHGTEGSLLCPDPNNFGGDVLLWTTAKPEWTRMPSTHNDQTGRGTGLAEMAEAIQQRRPHRASAELGLHVVEIMESFLVSARTARAVQFKSTCRQPAALPAGLPLGKLS
jgi:predicted dehydrogenase